VTQSEVESCVKDDGAFVISEEGKVLIMEVKSMQRKKKLSRKDQRRRKMKNKVRNEKRECFSIRNIG